MVMYYVLVYGMLFMLYLGVIIGFDRSATMKVAKRFTTNSKCTAVAMFFIVAEARGKWNRVSNDVLNAYKREKAVLYAERGSGKMYIIVRDMSGCGNRVSNDIFHLYKRKAEGLTKISSFPIVRL
ncbi:hypothetical protein ACFQZT_16060 [Paenibacillus sp. GCM10027628]|uniref:hypothetical protein n=1 Tax=Paenibacillus sp. GCM10027628 TaxID=3273413 RepID=UPI00363107B4